MGYPHYHHVMHYDVMNMSRTAGHFLLDDPIGAGRATLDTE